jgi:hypothetical protein
MTTRDKIYLVIWWYAQFPHAATFDNKIAAMAAANVRNALMITISGDAKIDDIVDWYRRDDAGNPVPAEWRDLVGQLRGPPAPQEPT